MTKQSGEGGKDVVVWIEQGSSSSLRNQKSFISWFSDLRKWANRYQSSVVYIAASGERCEDMER